MTGIHAPIAVDWEQHRYDAGVLCEFRPRAEYKGRATRPGMMEKAGTRFVLRTLWLMDNDDPYPGEFALSTCDSASDGELMRVLDIHWVASGDVVAVSIVNPASPLLRTHNDT